MTEKTGDPDYTRLFSSAETLHANFYHNFLTRKTFEVHREDALKLIEKLKRYLGV
ncbi:MAG: PaREP1 family protein [Sulfolobales archaeon]